MARCPSLHPPGEPPPIEKTFDISCEKPMKEVHLSAYIYYKPLIKLMEFIYSGYMLAEDNLVTSLKILARRCNVAPLLQLLSRKIPQWGTPFPRFDLTVTLGPTGHNFSYAFVLGYSFPYGYLDAGQIRTSSWRQKQLMMQWTCGFCFLPVPHMHVHKVILWSSCDYLRALLQSGMQESYSQRIKVPICWEALSKLVHWFHSGELPKPVFGYLWDSMDSEEKLHELLPYVELSWLAEYSFLNEVQEDSYRVIDSCLKSAQQLFLKIMQTDAEFSLWKLTETATNYMAPLYHQLCNSGDLEAMDEDLIDMVRAASV